MTETEASTGHTISRLAESSEETMRNLVALPFRMLAGAAGIFEALFRTAADAISEGDSVNERLVELRRRMDSLEEKATGRPVGSSATSATRKKPPTGSAESA
jgi:hypothetical protein